MLKKIIYSVLLLLGTEFSLGAPALLKTCEAEIGSGGYLKFFYHPDEVTDARANFRYQFGQGTLDCEFDEVKPHEAGHCFGAFEHDQSSVHAHIAKNVDGEVVATVTGEYADKPFKVLLLCK